MGKIGRVQDFVAKKIGDRNFGRGREPEIGVLDLEQIVLELGKLPGAEQAGRVDQERRQHFGIAVLARVNVQHEVDQRAFQPGADAPIDGKPRAGDFGGALQIQNLQLGPEIPMRLGLKIELARLAPAADFDVVVRALAHRHGFVRNIRNAGHQIAESFIDGLGFFIQGSNAIADLADLLLDRGGVLPGFLELPDFDALGVLLRLQLSRLRVSAARRSESSARNWSTSS